MQNNWQQNKSRIKERIWLLCITVVLVLLFNTLFKVQAKDFDEVPQRLADGSMVNLNEENASQHLKTLLEKGFYFEDPNDVQLISSVVSQRLNYGDVIDIIGELNKSIYY